MEFENDESILLKKAQKLKIPSKFVKIGKEKDDYVDITQEISNSISTGVSLFKLYEKYQNLDISDLIVLYAIFKDKKEDTLTEINKLYEVLNLNKIQNSRELYDFIIPDWKRKYEELLIDEESRLENILIIQEEMKKYPPLFYSKIKILSTILYADMKYQNRIPLITDAYEIFDYTKPDKKLPFVKWNTNLSDPKNKEIFKIYTGSSIDNRNKYNFFPRKEKEIPNSFVFSIAKNLEENTFLKGTYGFNTNLLKIKIPKEDIENKDKILEKISDVFPLVPENINEKSISGEFFIFDVDVNDLILGDMVLNDEFMNNYLFMKEMTSPLALKTQIKLFFRSVGSKSLKEDEESSSVTFIINQNYAKGGEIVSILRNDKEERVKLEEKTPYVTVRITSAESIEVAEKFAKILSRLLSRYKVVKEETENIYKLFIPEYEEERKIFSSKIKGLAETKIAKLQQEAPDLFVPGYARKCPKQPVIIPEKDVSAWKKQTFTYKNRIMEREILELVLEDGRKLNFGCPIEDDKKEIYPFPGLKKNNLSNKEIYPNIPCCYKTNKSLKLNYEEELESKDLEKEDELETEELEREEEEESKRVEEEVVKKSEHLIKTDKILEAGRYGLIPESIVNLLKNKIKGELFRKGVMRTKNSILHCIHTAIKDKKYLEKSEKEKEIYIESIRKEIAKSIQPAICKQELYDFTENEIINKLSDNTVFLDPNLYFRALEEAYNINIFVFAPSEDEEKRLKNKEKSIGVIETPRYKLFSARTPRPDKYSILIYRTMGSESTVIENPQCELIVNNKENSESALFGKDIYKLVFEAILTTKNVITWELVSEENNVNILARDNIYSRVNYYELTGKKANKQYIDNFGKMRGLYVENMLIIFPPSAPENLAVSTEIIRSPLQKVLKLFNDPVAVSLNEDQYIDGLWYSVLDIIYGIFIPIIPINKKELKLPIGPENPLGNKGEKITERLRKLKRDLDFILQILKWLLSLSKISLEEFMYKYTIIGTGIEMDSSKIYDFRNIGRNFPNVNSVEEGIQKIKERIPSLFLEDKVFLYSKKFYEGILYFMKKYVNEYNKFYMKVPKMITRKYLTDEDFMSYEGISLFLSEYDLKIWLNTLDKTNDIVTFLKIDDVGKKEPYLYFAPDGHIYLIQNVIEGNLNRAINVSFYWDKYKVNPGFKTPEYDENENPKYVVYDISQANNIILSENHAGDSTSFYSILRYNTFPIFYASMLLLL